MNERNNFGNNFYQPLLMSSLGLRAALLPVALVVAVIGLAVDCLEVRGPVYVAACLLVVAVVEGLDLHTALEVHGRISGCPKSPERSRHSLFFK